MNFDEILFEEDKLKIAEAITYHPLGSYQMGEIARISGLIADTGYDVVGYLERLRMERTDSQNEQSVIHKIEGEVILSVQTDERTYHVDYPDVTNEYENLTEILEDHFLGKKVRATIEEIK